MEGAQTAIVAGFGPVRWSPQRSHASHTPLQSNSDTDQPPKLSALRPRSTMASAAPAASTHRVDGLQEPHGGKLVNLQAPKDQWDAIVKSATKTLEASDRNACDVELLSVG